MVKSEPAYFGERPERTCHVSSADMETHKRKKGESECEKDRNLALCTMWKHSCMYRMTYGLSSASACVICCFHCVMPQLPGALYLCVQAQIWCCVHWLGHGSWPESF